MKEEGRDREREREESDGGRKTASFVNINNHERDLVLLTESTMNPTAVHCLLFYNDIAHS